MQISRDNEPAVHYNKTSYPGGFHVSIIDATELT